MINLKEFKQAILQKAMQGKLTKQLPSDGNAKSFLYEFNVKRKNILSKTKSKKIIKYLSQSPYVNNGEKPFNIPKNWRWMKFLSLYKFTEGSQPPKSHFITHKCNGYIRLYQTRDYGPNPRPAFIPKKEARKISRSGDILVSRYSSGKVFVANNGAYNVTLLKLTPLISNMELSKKFMWCYLNSYMYQNLVNSTSRAVISGFNKNDLSKLIIPVPPLAEQQRIVSKVHKCFLLADTIQKERNLHQKFAHDMKQSLLLEAMKGHLTQQLPSDGNADNLLQKIQQKKQQLIQAGKIRKHKKLPPISKNEIPFKIPKNWKWVRLGQLTLIISGRDIPKREQSKLNNVNNIPYVTGAGNFISSHIVTNTFLNKNLASVISIKNDLLITVKGTVGKLAFLPFKEAHIARQIIAIRFLGNMIPMFISYLLQLTKVKLSNESKSIIPGIKRSNLENLLVPLPPLPEQHRIVSKLHDLFNTINA